MSPRAPGHLGWNCWNLLLRTGFPDGSPYTYITKSTRTVLNQSGNADFIMRHAQVYWVRKKRKIYAMFFYDFFHTILQVPVLGVYPMVFISYAPTSDQVTGGSIGVMQDLNVSWSSGAGYPARKSSEAACHLLFAILWWSISESCAIGRLGPRHPSALGSLGAQGWLSSRLRLSGLMSAFYFSVETQMTIGPSAEMRGFSSERLP